MSGLVCIWFLSNAWSGRDAFRHTYYGDTLILEEDGVVCLVVFYQLESYSGIIEEKDSHTGIVKILVPTS